MMRDFKNQKDHDVVRLGSHLDNKRIALLVTGSIAAYKTPSLVRHFRQYGADVHVYLTEEAQRYVTQDSLEWTSGNPVVTRLSAKAEHLYEFDAYVVAPATLNTIGQMADGKAGNAVTATLASALGRLGQGDTCILVAPAMHGTLEKNPAYQRNLRKLEAYSVRIVEPDIRQGKANLPSSHNIVVETARELSTSPLKGKGILVTAGSTPGRIDNVRLITNRFKGELGIEIANEAYMRGINVTLILGAGGIKPPTYLNTVLIRDFYEYHTKVMDILRQNNIEIGIFSAAVADFIPKVTVDGKIPSQSAPKSIQLKKTLKVIEEVRQKFPDLYMIVFKYEEKISKEELKKIAKNRVRQGYQLIIANRGEDMSPEGAYSGIVMDKNGILAEPTSKKECAAFLLDLLEKSSL